MKKFLLNIAFFVIAFFITSAYASFSQPVITHQSKVSLVNGGYDENNIINLGLYYELEPDWHIYWRTAGDTGYPPKLDWTGSDNIESTEFLWPVPTRSRYKITEKIYTESYEYQNEVLFPILITPKDSSKPASVRLHVNYAICAEICIPAEADLKLEIPASYYSVKTMNIINKHIERVPKANGTYGIDIKDVNLSSDKKYLQIVVSSKKGTLKNASVFIEAGERFAFYNPELLLRKNGHEAIFNAPVTFLADNESVIGQDFTITLAKGGIAIEKIIAGGDIGASIENIIFPQEVDALSHYTLWMILIFAFIGGFILNVMPCVLPVLSIKLLGVIKYGGGSKKDVAESFLVTACGIVFSFVSLAVLIIGLRSAGMSVGWGFHFQEPLFIIALVVIITFFAANMWGFYEFRLPVGIGAIAYKKSEKHHLLGHFLTGVFATLMATPCTAPFIGVAVGFAISRGPLEIISTFTAMGIGMAMPYLIFSIFPKMVTKLPRPGSWMLIIKNIMGWLLAITAVWLIWVLSNQLGTTAAVILLILSIIKVLKLWAANHIAFLAKNYVRLTILTAIVTLAFVLPIKVSDNEHHNRVIAGKIWQPFNYSEISAIVKSGKVVFVDVTADWCLTCKVNKLFVLETDEILSMLSEENIVAMRADWTNKDDDITDYMMTHNRIGIPFNIVYGPGAPKGIILSELLSKNEVISAIRKAKEPKLWIKKSRLTD